MKNKNLWIILALIFVVFSAYVYYVSHRSYPMHYPMPRTDNRYYLGGLEWNRSLDKEFQVAQQENKPVAVYFWSIWCQDCAGFQAKTLADPQVKSMLEKDYVLVAMDLDIDSEVAHKYNVSYPPYVIFFDGYENVLERVAGTMDADTFLPIVKRVKDKIGEK